MKRSRRKQVRKALWLYRGESANSVPGWCARLLDSVLGTEWRS